MAKKVGVAIVGCGGMGRTHARSLVKRDDVHFRILVDVRVEAAQALQKEVNAEFIATDFEDALEDPGVDIILICTHHHLHAPISIAAVQAGKNVFCEKPLALTLEECENVARAVESAGVKFMMGFQVRFSPLLLKLKEVVPKPWVTIGHIIDPKWGESSWANDPIEGGGNIFSQGCHCFDGTCFLNDTEPISIYAGGGNYHHPTLPIVDSVACTIRFAGGSVANVAIGDFGSPALLGKSGYQFFAGNVTATLYNLHTGEPEIRFWGIQPARLTRADIPGCTDSLMAHGYTQEMHALIDWISKDIDPVMGAKVSDGVRATKLAIKAFESIRTNQAQPL